MKYLETAWKVLAMLVIPLLGWGIRLEVKVAVQANEIQQMQMELREAKDIRKDVQEAGKQLVELRTDLKNLGTNLTEIKTLLRLRPE